jgi:hypothetical protein
MRSHSEGTVAADAVFSANFFGAGKTDVSILSSAIV